MMPVEKTIRRMTLRDLLIHSEKSTRDLVEHLKSTFWPRIEEFRDLTRPVRRHSHFPTVLAVQNIQKKMLDAHQDTEAQANRLLEQLQDIRERARRERISRS